MCASLIGGRYDIAESIGSGGWGIVYRATDRLNNQRVALKRAIATAQPPIFASYSDSVDRRFSLAQEFRALSALRHPNIISVIDYGFDAEQQPYFTMELLANAHTLLDAGRNQPLKDQVNLITQLLQALAYLHRHQIIHRDLKPANVLVVNGQVKVLDFGLSITRQEAVKTNGDTSGTLAYMAPEVLNGDPSSEASDLYAVGIMAYELFAGRHPFNINNIDVLIQSILTVTPDFQSVNLPRAMLPLLKRLLAKDPVARYSNAVEVITALGAASDQPIAVETEAIRESFIQAAQFVGRGTELALVSDALKRVRAGNGSAWLVAGESGVGKSRFLDEIRTRALVQGALVLRGQAISEGDILYHLWRESLRRLSLIMTLDVSEASIFKVLVPDISTLLGYSVPDAPSLPPQAAQERLINGIEGVFRRLDKPTVLILEDLHWAQESLDVLARLSQLVENLPLLILASYRDDERSDLPGMLPAMKALKLSRLSQSEITELSESILGEIGRQPRLVELIERETEGNVFFLVEVVRALAEDAGQLEKIGQKTLPRQVFSGGIQNVVQRRLKRLSDQERPLLRAAAVIGRHIDIRVLAQMSDGLDIESWLSHCATAAILEVKEERWRFVHDKLREGILAELSAEQRCDLHQRIARTIEELYAAGADQSATLAYHYFQGQNWEKAAEYLLKAGDAATQIYANAEARQNYTNLQEALTHLPDNLENRRRRVDASIRLASVSVLAESLEKNIAQLTAAEAIVLAILDAESSAEDQLRLARIHFWIGRTYFYRNSLRESVGYFQRVLATASQFKDEQLLALPSSVIGRVLTAQGIYNKAEPLLTQAAFLLEKAQNWQEWALSIAYLGTTYAARGQYHQALEFGQRGLERALQLNDATTICACRIMCALHHMFGNKIPEMLEEGRAALHVAEQSGDFFYLYYCSYIVSWALGETGDYKASEEYKGRAEEFGRMVGENRLTLETFTVARAGILFKMGMFDETLQNVEQSLKLAAMMGRSTFAEGRAHRLRAQVIAARTPTLFQDIDASMTDSIKPLSEGGILVELARSHYVWGVLLQQRSDKIGAKEHIQKAVDLFKTFDLPDECQLMEATLTALN